MKPLRLYAPLLVLSSLLTAPALAAPPSQLQACKQDFANAGCKPTTEEEANTCLEKYEKEGQKDDGLTHACYEAHERYEKRTGHHEKGEEKPHEHNQHGQQNQH